MTPELRARMAAAAVAGAKAIDYVWPGNDRDAARHGRVVLLHGNEHADSGRACGHRDAHGIDLVKEQIRVAAGEKLGVTDVPPLRGHVIEVPRDARMRPENSSPRPPYCGLSTPLGAGVRLDSHVYAGYTVPPYYDSLLAKLVCQGRDPPRQ